MHRGIEELDPDVTRLAVILPVVLREIPKRHPADSGDAVIAFLPMDRDVFVSQGAYRLVGELMLLALDLLEAQHVGRLFGQEAFDLRQAQPHRIDVPGGDRKRGHRAQVSG